MNETSGAALPEEFRQRMRGLLGDEFPAFLASFDLPRVRGLRLNPAKVTAQELRGLLGVSLEPVPWCPTGFVVPDDATLGGHPAHLAGLFYLQEPSSMSVAEALGAEPGWIVGDLAAAPGGKTTHLSSLLGDSGTVLANEVIRTRLSQLHDNLELWGSRNVVTTSMPLDRFADFGVSLDGVVLDVPCSGEGLFRRNATAIREWSTGTVRGSARRQERLLREASQLVRPGGVIVYSTCTFEVEENEEPVARFLETTPGWALEGLAHQPGFSPGLRVSGTDMKRSVRLWPHLVSGEGQFFARLRRTGGPVAARGERMAGRRRRPDRGHKRTRSAAQAIRMWREFHSRTVPDLDAPEERIHVRNDQVFLVVAETPSPSMPMTALALPGLPLGRVRPGRFDPHPALAHTLSAAEATQRVSWELDDPRLAAFLRGETVRSAGPDGWTLVCLNRWGLGWAKRSHNVLKNMLPGHTRLQAGRWAARR